MKLCPPAVNAYLVPWARVSSLVPDEVAIETSCEWLLPFRIVPAHLVSPLVTFAAAGTPLLIVTEAICFSTVALFKATA